MRRLQDEFLKDTDLRLVTITVDPERDTPAQLTKYADGFEADSERWLFLTDPTGQKDKIYPLILGSFLQRVEEAKGEMREPGSAPHLTSASRTRLFEADWSTRSAKSQIDS